MPQKPPSCPILAAHVRSAVARSVQETSSGPGGLARRPALHVQAAMAAVQRQVLPAAVQAKGTDAAGLSRPPAPHVLAAVAAVQRRSLPVRAQAELYAPGGLTRLPAPHVQAAVAAVQRQPAPPSAGARTGAREPARFSQARPVGWMAAARPSVLQAQQEQPAQQNQPLPAVTDLEIGAYLARQRTEAKKFSDELAAYMDDWKLAEVAETSTSPETGKTTFSLPEFRRLLGEVKSAVGIEKMKAEEKLKYLTVDLLLHEAGHTRAVKQFITKKDSNQNEEEDRNATELILRYIEILKQLNQLQSGEKLKAADSAKLTKGLSGPMAAKLFERIQFMLFTEKKYRWERSKATNKKVGLMQTEKKLNDIWAEIQAAVGKARKDPRKKGNLQENAQKNIDAFVSAFQKDIAALEAETGIKTAYRFDSFTGDVVKETSDSGMFLGQPVPANKGHE